MKRLIGAAAVLLTLGVLAPVALAGDASEQGRGGPRVLKFPGIGSPSQPSGEGSFRFGVSSSATQIEDRNPHTDWYTWTQPAEDGGMGKSPFVGDAVDGYSLALEDIELLDELNVDSYRFGIEWARVEPRRGHIDEAALDHYGALIDALRDRGIRPVVTVHHFANPVWVDDPADSACPGGPSDTNLCGLDHPEGGPMVVREMAEHAALLADRFGDRVDEWLTLNEPMVYMMFAHAFGAGPPGKSHLNPEDFSDRFVPAVRTYISAHAAMYEAIKKADPDSSVGLTLSVKQYVAVRDGEISTEPRDIAARDRFRRFFELGFLDALRTGTFDADYDGKPDERHPEWRDTLDWLGIQLYDRTGVSASGPEPGPNTLPVIDVDVCGTEPCYPALDPSYFVPDMGYESDPHGLYPVLMDYHERYPGLPLVVTESGIASDSGERRAEFVVRALESVHKARAHGADVRGYYHWSLLDNFEWLHGYGARFGLYTVDRSTMERTPSEAVRVYAKIAGKRKVTPALRREYGGDGPLSPEPGDPPAGQARDAATSGRRG